MKTKYILPTILAIDFFVLLFEASQLSISYSEAHTYFGYHGISGYISHLFTLIFGQNDLTLRLPMIMLHLLSVILLYKISGKYIKKERERLILVVIFILLPGVISSALLVHNAGLVIFATFLLVYIYMRYGESIAVYILLGIFSFIDHSFEYLFLSLVFFALYKRHYEFFFFNLLLIAVNWFIYGTDIGGYPTGHFLDALGVYAAIFSPVIFVYIVYVLYRNYLTKKFDIIWFVAAVPLLFSLLLSLRQKVHIEYYAPFVMTALLPAARTFLASYKVRLPRFRKKYRLLFNISLFLLLLNFLLVVSNKILYLYLENPKRHFAYDNHVAKELAPKLKSIGVTCIRTDYKMQLRLRFYGIGECSRYTISKTKEKGSKNVTVSYIGKPVYTAYVTKINIR